LILAHNCSSLIEIIEGHVYDPRKYEAYAQVFLLKPKIEANMNFMSVFHTIARQLWTWIAGDRPKDDEDTCPVCHKKDQVIPIRYGKPNKELMQRAKEGKVRLGGCVMSGRPSRYCKRDDKEF
jgi:hypothetical protein